MYGYGGITLGFTGGNARDARLENVYISRQGRGADPVAAVFARDRGVVHCMRKPLEEDPRGGCGVPPIPRKMCAARTPGNTPGETHVI